ncbi:alpha/beta fold hydrolase [Maribacter thermophilus]|uniref:alpha/beta fold hydrolase n=1 Tax=Maribacter thermophilus TaxID=1197874 RepID=UPI000641764A|nr:alpha/beta fold hydrolase [Maribacter thermophilus]
MNRFAVLFITLGFVLNVAAQTKHFTSFDDVAIAYTDEGLGNVILLVHGFLNSGRSWENTHIKKDLLEKGYRVITPDLRGTGMSDKPQDDMYYHNDAEVKDLQLLMSHLKIARYDAIGYSRGSIVLAKLLTKDMRIKQAVLGGMGIDFTDPEWDRRLMFAEAFDGNETEMTRGAVTYAKSINADFRSLHLQQKYQPVTLVEDLVKVKVKVLVIVGDKDMDNGDSAALSKVFKRGRLVRVPGDHNGAWKTKEFSKKVLRFL